MGTSTDAILCFGIDLGDPTENDEKLPWDHEHKWEDFKDWWAEMQGCPKPIVEYSTEADKALYHAYWQKRDELEKKCPVELVTHCHIDAPCYVLAVRGTVQTANRGEVLGVKTGEINPTPLIDFCAQFKIKMLKQPDWLIVSYWG